MRALLADAGTNLHRVSAITKQAPYGEHTAFAIPHWFYTELVRGETPHICQIVALSRISSIPFVDCMAAFGYRLDDIPTVQLRLASAHPILLTFDRPIDAVDSLAPCSTLEQTAPYSEVVTAHDNTPFEACGTQDDSRYAYVKTSETDASLYPRIGAGSIVRIDRSRTKVVPASQLPTVFAVEWRAGLTLTFLKLARGSADLVVLPPCYPALEQTVGRDLTILGAVDWELRPLTDRPQPQNVRAVPRMPRRSSDGNGSGTVGAVLRRHRERAGLTYREAHRLTLDVSRQMDDPAYAISQSSLFNYELSDTLPRHVPKILSLCAVYGMSLWTALDAAGIRVEPGAQRRPVPAGDRGPLTGVAPALPLELCDATPALLDTPALSLDDVYVCGRRLRSLNPLLHGAAFITIDRRQRNVARVNARAKFRRPMFLVREPSGQFLTGVCSIDRQVLTVQPCLRSPTTLARFATRDVEVIGRVTGVIRYLDPTDEHPAPRRA